MSEIFELVTDWDDLDAETQAQFSNDEFEWKNAQIIYHIENNVPWNKNFETSFYLDLLREMKRQLLIYPYYLVSQLASMEIQSAFHYYIDMIWDWLRMQKSYDEIPSFTSADILRISGVHRNSYMTLQRKVKRMGPRGQFSRIIRNILPMEPMPIPIEYWWGIQPNLSKQTCNYDISSNDLGVFSKIYDAFASGNKPVAGLYDRNALEELYKAQLIEFDVKLSLSDWCSAPSSNAFNFLSKVMITNQHDMTLSKISKLLDDQITLYDVMEKWDLPKKIVLDSVALLCRLGFTDKDHSVIEVQEEWHESWMQTRWSWRRDSVDTSLMNFSYMSTSLKVSILVQPSIFAKAQMLVGQEKVEHRVGAFDLNTYFFGELEDDLLPLQYIVRGFSYRNFAIKSCSNIRGYIGLAIGKKPSIVFMEMPELESTVYQLFKMYSSANEWSTLYVPQNGNWLNIPINEIASADEVCIFAGETMEVVHTQNLVYALRSHLERSPTFLIPTQNTPEIIQVPLPLSLSQFSDQELREFLTKINSTQRLDWVVGYLDILNIANSFYIVGQHHGLPIHNICLIEEILHNLRNSAWFQAEKIDRWIEAQQKEVFHFREFLCTTPFDQSILLKDGIIYPVSSEM